MRRTTLRRIQAAIGVVARFPRTTVRLLGALGRGDGWSAGRIVGEILGTREGLRGASALLAAERIVVGFEREGVHWSIPSGDLILADMLSTGGYEREEQEALLRFLSAVSPQRRAAKWVLEVGANVGTTSVPMARAGFSVVALEPIPGIADLLERNIADNELSDRVLLRRCAIGSRNGVIEMLVSSDGGSEVLSDDRRAHRPDDAYLDGRRQEGRLEVEVHTLDEIARQEGIDPADVAFVWSDTEGYEASVIEGGASLWQAGVPMWVEFWPAGLEAQGGIDRFIATASEHFAGFIDSAELKAGGSRPAIRPMQELKGMARDTQQGWPSWWSTDLLLLTQ